MAISGWFHIPQEAEDGFEPGLEERLAEKSSLQQLQGKADQFDLPRIQWHDPALEKEVLNPLNKNETSAELSESDLEYLLKYMTPNYLTPDTVEELNELFAEESILQLSNFLNQKFVERLRSWLLDSDMVGLQKQRFQTSRPPHKHRHQYIGSQPASVIGNSNIYDNPFEQVLNNLLTSLAFQKWLSLATGLTLKRCSVIGRWFRRGLDYQLAQAFEGEDPQLEYCLCITPTTGWGGDDDAVEQNSGAKPSGEHSQNDNEDNVGGYELYMAGDEPDSDYEGSDDGVEIPAKIQSQTGAGDRRNAKRRKADPAIYQAAADDEDDGILVSNPAAWNTLSIVLRDRGTLRFVKYVSQSAPGDRWDFAGSVEVETEDDDEQVEAEAAY